MADIEQFVVARWRARHAANLQVTAPYCNAAQCFRKSRILKNRPRV